MRRRLSLQIKVNDNGVIEDAKFKTYGCTSAIASSSLVTELIKGKTLEEAEQLKNTAIAEELELPPVKIHCSILAEDAIKAQQWKIIATNRLRLRKKLMSVTLTEKAASHVEEFLRKRGKGIGLRVGVKTSGCSGMAYALEFADKIEPEDQVYESFGIKVIVDPKSLPYINGTELDFVREGLNTGFKFKNPNEKESCGCGKSFHV
mgnify:CR=1 FL=1